MISSIYGIFEVRRLTHAGMAAQMVASAYKFIMKIEPQLAYPALIFIHPGLHHIENIGNIGYNWELLEILKI
jgi:hypothetical protein